MLRELITSNLSENELINKTIEYENIQFLNAIQLIKSKPIQLNVEINRLTNDFQINENDVLTVTGKIRLVPNVKPIQIDESKKKNSSIQLKNDDFYREMRIRGYDYQNDFRCIESISIDGSHAQVKWLNWITFLDNMLQTLLISIDSRSLYLPTVIRSIRINMKEHTDYIEQMKINNEEIVLNVTNNKYLKRTACAGIEIFDLTTSSIARRQQNGIEAIDSYQFVPFFDNSMQFNQNNVYRIIIQLIDEMTQKKYFNIVEIFNEKRPAQIESISQAINKLPQVDFKLSLLTNETQREAMKSSNDNITVITEANESIDILILSYEQLKNKKFMENIDEKLSKTTFFICLNDTEICDSQYDCITALIGDNNITYSLLKPKGKDIAIDKQSIDIINFDSKDEEFKWLNEIQEKLRKTKANILIVSENEKHSGVLGFVKCLKRENFNHKIQCIVIIDEFAPKFEPNKVFYEKYLFKLPFILFNNDKWGTYRHITLDHSAKYQPKVRDNMDKFYTANCQQIGNLSTLLWEPTTSTFNTDDDLIKICYSAINFRDIVGATGLIRIEDLNFDTSKRSNGVFFGFEYSGIARNGDRVCGIVPNSGFSTYKKNVDKFTWKVPDNISLRDASTIPIIYWTLYYTFFMRTNIRSGQSILIHSGCGGIGLAAIRIALTNGLKVFTTVSNKDKKDYLLKTFPQLMPEHIGNSRDCSFEEMIMNATNGRGVDHVLNSLTDDKLLASVRCLADHGNFLEIGKYDMANDRKLGMHRTFAIDKSFVVIDPTNLDETHSDHLYQLIDKDLKNGTIKPLPVMVYPPDEIQNAFKHLSSGKHIGKLAIQIRDDDDVNEILPMNIISNATFKDNKSYVVVGGLGDFGMEFIDWMYLRGARNIIISSRRQPWSAYQSYRIK